MSSYDGTKQNIVEITTHIITELMSGIKPREYLKRNLPIPTKVVNSHFPKVIDTLVESGVIELADFEDSDFQGYRLTYSYQNKRNNFKGDLTFNSMARDIEVLKLDTRTENALRDADINSLGDLIKYNPDDYWNKVSGVGDKGIKQIENSLSELGLFIRY